MAEEKEEQGGTSIKSIIIGLVSTVTLGVGGFITNKLTGGDKEEDKPAAAAPVINIQNTNQQSQAAGKTVIIKEKAADAKPTQAQPAAKPKKDNSEYTDKPAQW